MEQLRFDLRSPSSKVHCQSSHYSAYPRFLVWKCIGVLSKIHGQVLEMQCSLQNFNLYRLCNGKFKSQTYATWSLNKTVSQNGVSYTSVTVFKVVSIPKSRKAAHFKIYWGSECSLAGLSTVDNMCYQLLQWPDDHLGTIFSIIYKCPSNSK